MTFGLVISRQFQKHGGLRNRNFIVIMQRPHNVQSLLSAGHLMNLCLVAQSIHLLHA